jgi:hypothetical protein
MKLFSWIDKLREQFDTKELGHDVIRATITIGMLSDNGVIHYHTLDYSSKNMLKPTGVRL